jgi:hypothetical protein
MRGHGGMMTMPPMSGVDPNRMWQPWQRQWQNRSQNWDNDLNEPENDDNATPAPTQRGHGKGGARTHSYGESHSSSIMTETRDGLTVTITDRDGKKTVKAEEDGKVIVADKPLNTDDQLKDLPEKVRDRVTEMQKTLKGEAPATPAPQSHGPNISL